MNPGFTSNKPTHYVLDYGELVILQQWAWPVKHKRRRNEVLLGGDQIVYSKRALTMLINSD